MLVSTVIFFEHYAGVLGTKEHYRFVVAALVYLLGILMVSNVRYISSKALKLRGKSPFKVMVVASLILITIALKPEVTFFSIGVVYVLSGLFETIPGFPKILKMDSKESSAEDEDIDS
jgi:CDP-diacylglycerol---serine O-phosphatidyltransferase